MTGLKPFFSFYGGKWGLSLHYPEPRYKRIIEPFAGSAGYSIRHANHDVTLVDKDPVIVGVWRWLIQASRSDILSLPLVFASTADLDIPPEAKHLLGFWIARGRSTPAITPSAWMRSGKFANSFWSAEKRDRIARQVGLIRHWDVRHGSYDSLEDAQATWFVDPPYASQGQHYRVNKIDYGHLAGWCMRRDGQVMVCEQHGAEWMPFVPFRKLRGVRNGGKKISHEVIYSNPPLTPSLFD